ncbi:PASTA domain-containing protein [Trueperella sp. LYQ141]|uniref:Stk1 family PASTA domain-containing Ser/Thr kinase n=1 Tax=Trueperella sp. LYQ141 TaxID=3391058 RepID=UPI003982E5E4
MKAPDSLLGTVIDDRYVITARISRGGMATVYRATDQRLERSVAVKVIHAHLAKQPDFVRRFILEARSAAGLSNPHIVAVHDQGVLHTVDGERPYLVMELVHGPDLRSELNKNGSLPLGISLTLIEHVLRGISAAHHAGIIHRDLKPENVLLSSSIDPAALHPTISAKVTDFGLARAASDATSTQTSTLMGTVGYVAPELISDGNTGKSADIYSVGIMLYELIAGRQPFTGESPIAVAFKHVNEPTPRLADQADWIPPALDSLIGLFTAKSPDKRPQDGSAALIAMEDIIATIPEDLAIRRIPVFPNTSRNTSDIGAVTPIPSGITDVIAHGDYPSAHLDSPETAEKSLTKTDVLPHTTDNRAQSKKASSLHASPKQRKGARFWRRSSSQSPATTPVANVNATTRSTVTSDIRTSGTNRHDTPIAAPPRRSRKRWIGTFVFLILLAAICTGAWWYFAQGPGHRVAIPNVANQNQQTALTSLQDAGLTAKVTQAYSDTVPQGNAISTDPVAGTDIHPRNPVTLIISAGIEHVTIPDVTGQDKAHAEKTMTDNRLTPQFTEAYSETVAAGLVISQNPAAGQRVPHSSAVVMTLSKGREPISVPDLRNATLSDATAKLSSIGLTANGQEEFSDTVPAGIVISQEPAAGETRYRGDQITLHVSKGPELFEVPDVFGKQENEATRILEQAGFTVKTERVLGGLFGTVRSQSPAAGQMRPRGTVITLTIV